MLEQKVTFGAFTAVHALIILQDILHVVDLHWVIALDLAAVTADDLHAQATKDHLALVAVSVALVLGGSTGLVVEFSPLCSSLCHVRRAGARVTSSHIHPLFKAGDYRGALAEGIKRFHGRVHSGFTFFIDSCLGALEVAFTRRGSWPVRIHGR